MKQTVQMWCDFDKNDGTVDDTADDMTIIYRSLDGKIIVTKD